jgi:hypothetical protein
MEEGWIIYINTGDFKTIIMKASTISIVLCVAIMIYGLGLKTDWYGLTEKRKVG